MIARARELIDEGLRTSRSGRFVLQAAITSVHAQSPSFDLTDWAEIVRLYDELLVAWPSPVVALNRAVAVSMVDGPLVALAPVEELSSDPSLADYHYVAAIKSDLPLRLGRADESLLNGQRAVELTRNETERAFLDAQVRGRRAPDA